MYDSRPKFIYHPEVIQAILAANSVKLLTKTLKRLELPYNGRKEELLRRLANFLATKEGKAIASTKKISA
jgi:hypothetical protein